MTDLSFKCLKFNKLTWEQWLTEYRSDIRIGIKWKKVRKPKIGLHLVETNDILFAPWYGKEGWMDGTPKTYTKGNKPVLVRLPAIKLDYLKYFLPDGNHRISELKPAFIVLDYLELKSGDEKYIVDMHNEFYENIWKGV